MTHLERSLPRLPQERADAGRPVRIGPIGAGELGTMFLAQVRANMRHRGARHPCPTSC